MDPNAPQAGGFMGGMQNTLGGIGDAISGWFQPWRDAPLTGGAEDPFSNLSRQQRMMLGFAALRDAGAALQGQESGYFSDALGVFDQGRERERLRAQGMFQNQVQGAQALAMIQQQIILGQRLGQDVSGLQAMADQIQGSLMGGFGGATSAGVVPSGGVALPTAIGTTLPVVEGYETPSVTGAGGAEDVRPTPGVVMDADGIPVPGVSAAEEQTIPPSVFDPSSFTNIEDVDAALAQLREENALLATEPTISAGGITISSGEQIASNMMLMEALIDRRDQLITAQQEQEGQLEQQSLFVEQIPAAVNAMSQYLTPDGEFISAVTQRVYASGETTNSYEFQAIQGALAPLASVRTFENLADARASGYTGTLTDTDIQIISGVGGVLDASNPRATIQTLRQIYQHPDLSDEARRLMNIPPEWAAAWGGPQSFAPTEDDISLVDRYTGGQ
jgi:hypothetical protein